MTLIRQAWQTAPDERKIAPGGEWLELEVSSNAMGAGPSVPFFSRPRKDRMTLQNDILTPGQLKASDVYSNEFNPEYK